MLLIAAGPLGKAGHCSGLQFPWRVNTRAADQGASDCAIPRSQLDRDSSVFTALVCHLRFWLKKGPCAKKKKKFAIHRASMPMNGLSSSEEAGTGCGSLVEKGRYLWLVKLWASGTNRKASLIISVHVISLPFQESLLFPPLPRLPQSSHLTCAHIMLPLKC